jgi:hypothetical protein
VFPCSLVNFRVSPASPSHLKLFDAGKSSVCLVDLVLPGILIVPSSADIRFSLRHTPNYYGLLRAIMAICFPRFIFCFSVSSFLSFIHFLSGYTRDMIGVRSCGSASSYVPAISYVTLCGWRFRHASTRICETMLLTKALLPSCDRSGCHEENRDQEAVQETKVRSNSRIKCKRDVVEGRFRW